MAGTTTLPTTRRKKNAVEFELDDNDAPILNDPSQMTARDMEPLVRQYMSIHYSEYFAYQMDELFYLISLLLERCSGGKKSAVDWAALSENQDDMIHHKYLPDDFTFRDPSKMRKAHYQSLLEHWYMRQEDDSIDVVFAFKGYWNPSDNLVVTDKQSKSSTGKHRTAPTLAASRLKGADLKTKKKANAAQNRAGPPGIRKGEKYWQDYSGEEENADEQDEGEDEGEDKDKDEEECEEDEDEEDEDDSGEDDKVDSGVGGDNRSRKRGIPSKAPPMDLPFSAKRVVRRGAPALPKTKGSRLPAVAQKSAPKSKAPSKKAREDMGTSKNHRERTFDNDRLDAADIKRPQPRPAHRGPQSDGAGPSVPQPIKPARKRNLGPQFEGPTTRNGAKRKADDAELRAAGESSKKRAKRPSVKGGKGN